MSDPVVRVGSPSFVGQRGSGVDVVVLTDVLTLDCSEHGELDFTNDPERDRHWLQKIARDHANAEHDGLAVNVGWSW